MGVSTSTVSATVQDPTGQVFANGTWQLLFKPTPGIPGPFNDGGSPFTQLYGGSLDGAGSFSQAGVARTDTITPAGARWTLTVTPNASSPGGGQSFPVDLNVNSPAFNASAAVNAAITNILVNATPIAHAYRDSEIILTPQSGGLYFDVTLKQLKVFDPSSGNFLPFSLGAGVIVVPFSATPALAGLGQVITTFQMTLTANVTAPVLSGIPTGGIVILKLIENNVGGWTFAYPGNFLGFQALNNAPNTTNLQMGVFDGVNLTALTGQRNF